ncbi:MAG: hypothetical protein AAF335_05190, partial [Bacteroidota bacterium]
LNLCLSFTHATERSSQEGQKQASNTIQSQLKERRSQLANKGGYHSNKLKPMRKMGKTSNMSMLKAREKKNFEDKVSKTQHMLDEQAQKAKSINQKQRELDEKIRIQNEEAQAKLDGLEDKLRNRTIIPLSLPKEQGNIGKQDWDLLQENDNQIHESIQEMNHQTEEFRQRHKHNIKDINQQLEQENKKNNKFFQEMREQNAQSHQSMMKEDDQMKMRIIQGIEEAEKNRQIAQQKVREQNQFRNQQIAQIRLEKQKIALQRLEKLKQDTKKLEQQAERERQKNHQYMIQQSQANQQTTNVMIDHMEKHRHENSAHQMIAEQGKDLLKMQHKNHQNTLKRLYNMDKAEIAHEKATLEQENIRFQQTMEKYQEDEDLLNQEIERIEQRRAIRQKKEPKEILPSYDHHSPHYPSQKDAYQEFLKTNEFYNQAISEQKEDFVTDEKELPMLMDNQKYFKSIMQKQREEVQNYVEEQDDFLKNLLQESQNNFNNLMNKLDNDAGNRNDLV